MPQDVEAKTLTLSTLAGGAVEELFAEALQEVLNNIGDPNTDHKAKRAIMIKIDFDSDEERRVGSAHISCATKLAGVKGVSTGLYFGTHKGKTAVVEAPRQEALFKDPAPERPQVLPGGKTEEAAG